MQEYDALKQFRLALISLVALLVLGTTGYHVLQGWSWLDSVYMTVNVLATVGIKEVRPLDATGQVFTTVLIMFGVAVVFWAAASLIEAVISEQMWHALQRKRMNNRISKMRDHYIVCGFGRMGQQIVRDLQNEGVPHVVIEQNPEQLPKLNAQEIPYVEGNASDDKALEAAGIERAKGLITVAPTDEDNVFITLSARALNPDLFIMARSIMVENENKLRVAGADRVMSPYVLGGRRMATAVLRPNVLDFLELAMHTEDTRVVIEELPVLPGSSLLGTHIGDSAIKKKTGAAVIAIKKQSGKMIANPPDEEVMAEGDVLIVLGTPEQLQDVETTVCPAS
jgi:voltage-gated potassium channel